MRCRDSVGPQSGAPGRAFVPGLSERLRSGRGHVQRLQQAREQRQSTAVSARFITKLELGRLIRNHVAAQFYDDSGLVPRGSAIYSLADPRDLREVRYVGRTSAPRRRFLQHLSTAMLWLGDDTPWWVKAPKMRPLSGWIRELYRDEHRLPVMIVTDWIETLPNAKIAERTQIYDC